MNVDAIDRAALTKIMVIDIGGTQIKFGYSLDGEPHPYRGLFPADRIRNAKPIDSLAELVKGVIREIGIEPQLILATVPGFIDTDEDHVLFAGNLPELNSRALAGELMSLLGCPVFLERDSIMALIGEITSGVARGCDFVLGVFFGTGVGGAFVQNGLPFRGAGWALEIGHMPLRAEGRKLPGLRTDCLETYASGRVLTDIATRHQQPVASVFTAAETSP
jgi:allose kinase